MENCKLSLLLQARRLGNNDVARRYAELRGADDGLYFSGFFNPSLDAIIIPGYPSVNEYSVSNTHNFNVIADVITNIRPNY